MRKVPIPFIESTAWSEINMLDAKSDNLIKLLVKQVGIGVRREVKNVT